MDASFLSRVSKTVLSQHQNLSELVFVLPNQRSGVYLQEALKKELTTTVFLPEIITFDHLAEQMTSISKLGSIELLFDFYSIYITTTKGKKPDSFDVFSGWATTVLDDFNDIDAHLVNPKRIFSNLKAINEIHNWSPETLMTQNYLIFLSNLEIYYNSFYSYLIEHRKGYQGLILKEAVATLQEFIKTTTKHFVFVGFNYLKESESLIIQDLLKNNKANVFWNISADLLESNHNAGRYIRNYKKTWPYYQKSNFNWVDSNKFTPDNTSIIGVSKNVGTAKTVGDLLSKNTNNRTTALVLPNQSLLLSILNSFPKNSPTINITMGYPLHHDVLSNLVDLFFKLHIQSSTQNNSKGYYYKTITNLIKHPAISGLVNFVPRLVEIINIENRVFLSFSELDNIINKECLDCELLKDLFQPIEFNNPKSFLERLLRILLIIKKDQEILRVNVLYKLYSLTSTLLKLIERYNYIDNLSVLFGIYKNILFSERITFIGEAEKGVQVMGLLEAQNGSFDHLILTSLNEGILPQNKQANSFIPFDVRLEFGLPTYRDQDAITSFLFFQLIRSSKKISLLYTTETDTFGGGEISRFLVQLLWIYPNIKTQLVNPNLQSIESKVETIIKTKPIIDKLKALAAKGFSPSALGTYLYNPLEFYYQKVLGIYEVEEVEETIASNTMGSILHATLEELYTPFINKQLSVEGLNKAYSIISQTVEKHYKATYKNGYISEGKNKLVFEVIVHFVKRFISSEIKAVKQGQSIIIRALEKSCESIINFPNLDFPIKLIGEIDRVDEVDGVLRIIDYKSGKVESNQLRLDDMSQMSRDYKYSKAMQVLIYAYMYTTTADFNFTKQLEVGIVSFKNLKNGFMPVNFAAGRKKETTLTKDRMLQFVEELETLFLEIFDLETMFKEIE